MILSIGLGSNLGQAADKSIPQEGDNQTFVPSTILPVEKLLSPNTFTANVSATAQIATTSFFDHITKNRAASTGASADVLVVLTRGLWTIGWNLNAKFQSSGSFGSPAAIGLVIVSPELNDTRLITQVFRLATYNYFASGTFRLLCKVNWQLRLDIVATIVSDAIDCNVSFFGEKNI